MSSSGSDRWVISVAGGMFLLPPVADIIFYNPLETTRTTIVACHIQQNYLSEYSIGIDCMTNMVGITDANGTLHYKFVDDSSISCRTGHPV